MIFAGEIFIVKIFFFIFVIDISNDIYKKNEIIYFENNTLKVSIC